MRKELTAAGGVVYDSTGNSADPQVLLIFRRGVWDLPKGKQEKGESVEECAAREVAEEVGLPKLPDIETALTRTYHEYEQGGQAYGKTTHWYAMPLKRLETNALTPQAEEGIEQVRWAPLAEAKEEVGYDNLREVLQRFESWLAEGR